MMAVSVQKSLPLPNGTGRMPVVGLGTFTFFGQLGDAEAIRKSVKTAIEAGYRHIDCAWVYSNEEAVGGAIKQKIEDGTIQREDIFITTKLWDTHHDPKDVMPALKDSLQKLKIDYVDMFLVHWPISLQMNGFDTSDDASKFPKDENGKMLFADHQLEDTWKGMEQCHRDGLARNIGISNFNSKQTERIFECCKIKPSNMQVEINTYFNNKTLVEFGQDKGMVVTAYAPLGNISRPWREAGEPSPFEEPILKEIAATKGKSIAQIILRFHIQNGVVVVPKSITPSRIQENMALFDFTLTDEEMKRIASLDRNMKVYKESFGIGHPEYPLDESI